MLFPIRAFWRKVLIGLVLVAILADAAYVVATRLNINRSHVEGEVVDSFNGVDVFYNGGVNHTEGRNLSPDGYNLGVRYQCVEFIKRYYYVRFDHRMPDTYGNAIDYFDPALADGAENPHRALIQYRNGGTMRPAVDDIVVFAPWLLNRYGHVAIISAVNDDSIEVIQQNPGPFGASREHFRLSLADGLWRVDHPRLLGWLRLPEPPDMNGLMALER